MPRAGWRKPESERRLSDLVSVGVLTRVFPPELVDEVIAEVGRTEQRHRSLPARVMAYFSIGMALYSEGSYEDVLAQLTDGLSWASGWSETYTPPSKSAIFQARARLGAEPLAALFERVARPIGTDGDAGGVAGRAAAGRDRRDLPGRRRHARERRALRPSRGEQGRAGGVPAGPGGGAGRVRHARDLRRRRSAPTAESEATLAERLLDRLEPGMLLTADRGFFSYALWRKAIGDRCGPVVADPHRQGRPQADPRARTCPTAPGWPTCAAPHSAAARREEPMLVRVIDYTIDDGRENPTSYRLFTTLLDPDEVSAIDLAAAYAQRWEIELTFDELKTHQRGPRTVLRSKSPDLVLQEIWGHLCCHYAIRSPDGRGRHPLRARPRPGQLRRRPADHPPDPRPPGRFPPLTSTAATAPAG